MTSVIAFMYQQQKCIVATVVTFLSRSGRSSLASVHCRWCGNIIIYSVVKDYFSLLVGVHFHTVTYLSRYIIEMYVKIKDASDKARCTVAHIVKFF